MFFNLYISDEAESVSVTTSDNSTYSLERVSPANKHCWISRHPLFLGFEQETIYYHYVAEFKRNMFQRAYSYLATMGDVHSAYYTIPETSSRQLLLTTETRQYDIFRVCHNSQEHDRDIIAGVLQFVDMLYGSLNERSDFKKIFSDSESVCSDLPCFKKKDKSKISQWLKKVTNSCNTWYQSAFICSILGQLQKVTDEFSSVLLPETADKVLDSLIACKCDIIPPSSARYVKSTAKNLFKVCPSSGWLQFLIYFANLFEVEDLLRAAGQLPITSSEEEFYDGTVRLVRLLVPREVADKIKILGFVIDHCPNLSCLWQLYQEVSVYLPDITDALAERFSSTFCHLIYSGTKSKRLQLFQQNVWKTTPLELRSGLTDPFVEALKHQITQETALTKQQCATLIGYISDRHIRSSKQFVSLILGLAKNKNETALSSLVAVLNSSQFVATWKAWSHDYRSDVCKRLLENILNSHSRPNVVRVLESIKLIGETGALQCDREVQLVLEKFAIGVLQNVGIRDIMAAYFDLDHSSQIVESCYSSLLRNAVKENSRTGGDKASIIQFLPSYLKTNSASLELEPSG